MTGCVNCFRMITCASCRSSFSSQTTRKPCAASHHPSTPHRTSAKSSQSSKCSHFDTHLPTTPQCVVLSIQPCCTLIIIMIIIAVIFIALYLTDKGERAVLYKINKNVYIKASKMIIINS